MKFISEENPFTIPTHNKRLKLTAEEDCRKRAIRCFFLLDWYAIKRPGAIVEAPAHSEIESFRQNVSTPPILNPQARKEPNGSGLTDQR